MAASNPPWTRPATTSPAPRLSFRRWLVVSEDEKSSRLYFQGFPINRELLEVQTVGGAGDPRSVVERAMALKAEAETAHRPYARVYAVFDRDSHDPNRFQAALDLARGHDIKPVWANEAFELWYVLHLAYRDTEMPRTEFRGWLTETLRPLLGDPRFTYEKNDPGIYERLRPWQPTALKHAERLLAGYGDEPHPERRNPSTNVQTLVRALNGFLKLKPTSPGTSAP